VTPPSDEAAREAELSAAAAGVEPAPEPAEPWTQPPDAAQPAAAPERPRTSFAWALAVLILVLIALGVSPFWAPSVIAMLPWGPGATQPEGGTQVAQQQLQDVEQRLHALEQRPAPQAPQANEAAPRVDQLQQTVDQLGQKVDQVGQRLDQVGQRVEKVEQRPAGGQGGGQQAVDLTPLQNELRKQAASLNDLGNRVGELSNRVGAVEKSAAQQPAVDPRAVQALQGDVQKLAVNLSDLSNRLGKLETQEAAQAGAERVDQALMLALGQLREAVRGGRPYAAELATAKSLARDRQDVLQALQPLEANAAKGVPTLPALTQRFRAVANDIVHAEQAPPGEDWGDQIMARIRSLVTVRRVGAKSGDDPVQNAVAAAEGALDRADLPGAVQALDGLQGAPAQAAKPWLDQAHARLDALAALDRTDGAVVGKMAQGTAGSSAGGSADQGSAR
jgi:hypothetical protein